jgi:threonine dehydratase
VDTTSVRRLRDDAVEARLVPGTTVWLKEELFQRTGSFKPRGALTVMLDLPPDALARGVTGVSAGNHAISLGYSARVLGTTATVVMPRTANAFRVQRCRELGATVQLVDTVHEAFTRARAIERDEGRTFVHPYEGPRTALGTATLGLEFMEQVAQAGHTLDAVLIASGGGGLSAGVAAAVKQLRRKQPCSWWSPRAPTPCTAASPPDRRRASMPCAPLPTRSAHRAPNPTRTP